MLRIILWIVLFLLMIACPHGSSTAQDDGAGIVITPENADQVVELMRIGRGRATEVAVSPDGETLAIATTIGVWLYDVETWEVLSFLEHTSAVNSVAFSPDSTRIVSGTMSPDNVVQVWDVQTGNRIMTLMEHPHDVTDVAYSPDGLLLASTSAGNLRIWDALTGDLFLELDGWGGALAFSPDSSQIAAGCADYVFGGNFYPSVCTLDVDTGSFLLAFGEYAGGLEEVEFSPDGRYLATAFVGNRLWIVVRADFWTQQKAGIVEL